MPSSEDGVDEIYICDDISPPRTVALTTYLVQHVLGTVFVDECVEYRSHVIISPTDVLRKFGNIMDYLLSILFSVYVLFIPESGSTEFGSGPKSPEKNLLLVVKPNRVKTRLRRGASSGAEGGRWSRLRRDHLASPRHQCTVWTQCTGCSQYTW